jgi:aldehyde dehydrogenase (NAD+)
MNQIAALIDGKPVETAAEVPVEDPSTGDVMASTPDCGRPEVDAAVSAARTALAGWRATPVADRAATLRRIAAVISAHSLELAHLEAQQTGKPLSQGRRDVEITARYFDFYASAVEMLYGSTIPLNDATHVFTRWEPHGVVAVVIPWNYPLQIAGRSVAPALAMGNATVLKPAEEAPLTVLRLAQLALEAGLPTGLFNVVTGYGETTGVALTTHPGVDYISFTGSVDVGRLISHAAAEKLVPITMELGGKSPNIVFQDADLDRAIPVIVNSIIQMGGQTCSAGSRLLVHEAIHDDVITRIRDRFAAIRVGQALEDPDLGPLISARQRDRVLSYVESSRSDANVTFGGRPLNGGRYGNGFFVEPTLIDNVDPGSRIGQEEVFGPVLAATTFRDADEAVALANCTDYGLVAGVWTTSLSTAHRMIRDVVAGQVFVNTYGASGGVELPFGGFKHSGHGREKGFEALRGFSQLKTGVIAI